VEALLPGTDVTEGAPRGVACIRGGHSLALQLIGLEQLGWDEDELERSLAGIGDTLRDLYREADAAQITPEAAAERLVERRLSRAKS